jgi:hypothetical protein
MLQAYNLTHMLLSFYRVMKVLVTLRVWCVFYIYTTCNARHRLQVCTVTYPCVPWVLLQVLPLQCPATAQRRHLGCWQ